MIKTNQLRIGNYLMGSKIVQVKSIFDENTVGLDRGNPYHVFAEEPFKPCLNPIRLTEEWIIEFGAIQIKSKPGVRSCYSLFGIKFEVSNSGNVYHSQMRKPIVYVHRLQNLIFELKDIELTVKE